MSQVKEPRARSTDGWLFTERVTAQITYLYLGDPERTRTIVLLFAGYPVAVETGGIVHFHNPDANGAVTKAVNAMAPDSPHMRCAASDFDFIMGQVLTQAGLPLTRRV